MSVLKALKNKEVSQIRQVLHKTPELAGHEVQTIKFISDYLDENNIKNTRDDSGVTALIEAPASAGTLLLTCNISASPIQEKTNLPFASIRGGIMHATGNDAHIAILLTVAKELQARREELKSNIKIGFYSDAKRAAAKGALSGGVIAASKLQLNPMANSGDILIKKGKCLAANDNFEIVISGKGGDGRYPAMNSSITYVIAQIVDNLYSIVPRKFSAVDNALISVCNIECGRTHDVMPSKGIIRGMIQTYDENIRALSPVYIEQIAGCLAAAYEVDYDFKLIEGAPPVYNNEIIAEKLCEVAEKSGRLINLTDQKMGSDDFAYFSGHLRGCYFEIGCGSKAKSITAPLNSEYFNIDEDAMQVGIDVLRDFALGFR